MRGSFLLKETRGRLLMELELTSIINNSKHIQVRRGPFLWFLKAQQSLPGQRVYGEGLWLKLSGLSVCCIQCTSLTVWYVVCYQSVTRNSNNSSGYVYNGELITQPTPISHSPSKFKFWIWQFYFFSNSCFWCNQNYFSVYNLCHLHSTYLQSFTSELFVSIS